MNICSLVVHAKPGHAEHARSGLENLPGVEVHAGTEEGKMIVTVEDTEQSSANDTMMAVGDVDGVVNAVLIYHYGGEEFLEEEVIRESH